jgi:hypothetical protein
MPTRVGANEDKIVSKNLSSAYTVVLAFSGTISANIGLQRGYGGHRTEEYLE